MIKFPDNIAGAPGVYLFKDQSGLVLYVGKAKSLKNRLASYRRHAVNSGEKTAVLLQKAETVEIILTRTEKEALILEASLIKQHRPRYNIELKDDKSYPYIKVTVREEWPRVFSTRRRQDDGSRYFGPFSSAGAMHESLHLIRQLFPLRRCHGRMVKKRSRPCLNFQMGRCPAPCVGKADRDMYLEAVAGILLLLEGRNQQLIRGLSAAMKLASEALEFEKAAILRDQVNALEKTLEKQAVISGRRLDQDVFGIAVSTGKAAISVIKVRDGSVCGSHGFYLDVSIDAPESIVEEAVKRFYDGSRTVPAEILVPVAIDDRLAIGEWLADQRQGAVTLKTPRRGDRVRLLNIAQSNAGQVLTDHQKKSQDWNELAAMIAGKLRLRKRPNRIECLDISNIGGRQPVGSLVCFVDGEKKTSGYRHYKITGSHTPDDYAMMGEVLSRRFDDDAGWGELPDLLVLDGGKGQLHVGKRALAGSGLHDRIDLVAIAKKKKGEGEKLYLPGRKNALVLPRYSNVLLFFMRIRDEAHRFGITFHRKWRDRETLVSGLDGLVGIGPARKRSLLKYFGSLSAVRQANPEMLAAVDGISPLLARRIWDRFHQNEGSQEPASGT